jgi:hypothetical protein
MMQQQREGEREGEENSAQEAEKLQCIYRYSMKKLWILYLIAVCGTVVSCIIASMGTIKKIPFYYDLPLPLIAIILMGRQMTSQEEPWTRDNKGDVFLVDNEGIEWQNKEKTVYMRWDEITQAYRQNGMCILIKQGAGEEEIRFRDTTFLIDTTPKNNRASRKSLRFVVTDHCPLLQDNPWANPFFI